MFFSVFVLVSKAVKELRCPGNNRIVIIEQEKPTTERVRYCNAGAEERSRSIHLLQCTGSRLVVLREHLKASCLSHGERCTGTWEYNRTG